MASEIPTYVQIYSDIFTKIVNGEYKEGDKLPTELELCKAYYVSRITVKNALQRLVDKGLICRIPGKGTFVSLHKTETTFNPNAKIGLIMCDFGASYGTDLIRSIERQVGKYGKNLVLKNSYFNKEREVEAINELLAQGVEGIILQPTHNDFFNREVLKLSLNRFPIVIIDRELKSVDIPYVGTDNIAAMTTAMDYLFAMGHRNICFMSGATINTSTLENRLNGFRQAFLNKGYPGSANNEFSKIKSVCTKPTADLIEEDIRNIYEHIQNNPQITCIFASEYAVCSLVKQALKRAGKKVPDDMSLITFDNICDPFHFTETTYLKQNQTEIGVQAVDMLMKCIADGTTTSRIYLSCNLMQNSSVKDINP